MSEYHIPAGDFGDIAIDAGGVLYLALESPARDTVAVYRGQQLIATLPGGAVFDPERGWLTLALFPRIAVSPDGRIAVAYQRGDRIALALLGVKEMSWAPEFVPFGVEMVAVVWRGGQWRLAAVVQMGGPGGTILLVTSDYGPDGTPIATEVRQTQTTQGISRIDAAGVVWLVDEERIDPRWPDLHRPFVAGALVVGENMTGPERVIGYRSGSATRLRIFSGVAKQPRAVATAAGWTALAMSPGAARLVDLPPFVPDETPPIEPPPLPPKVTITDYQPREGAAPLTVRVTLALSGGPATSVLVTARTPALALPVPFEPVPDGYRATLTVPGAYAIRAIASGPGGTDATNPTSRIVTVHEKEEEPHPMYHIPRDIIAAGLAELRRIYDVHLRQALDDEGLAAWLFDVWVFAIYQGPDPGGNAGWQSRLAAANRAMRKAIQAAVPNPPGEGWPSDPQ